MIRRVAPYVAALAGAFAITIVIAAVGLVASASGLSPLYLLLVLWLAARWGRGPAVLGSIAAFLLYDFFFVPPVGTLSVSGPAQLVELVVLLAVALVTSQLAASLRRAQAASDALAKDERALYELATAALRTPETAHGLSLLCARASALPGVGRFALIAFDSGHPVHVGGASLNPDEIAQASWSYTNGKPVGMAIKQGAVRMLKAHQTTSPMAYMPLASGVAAMAVDGDRAKDADLRMLAALIGLADLLLDRRRAAHEAERVRGLEASDRLKAAILSSLSHELKTPLASLRAGLTALVAPQAGLEAEQRELLTDMDRQALRLDRMVGDMLALSRLEAGLDLRKEPHRFADLVGSALHQLRSQLQDRELVVRVSDELPPVAVDELQASRLITNLVENAVEWAPPHGVIEIGARVVGSDLEAWVENEGPAIAPADLDRVFDTFWTRRTKGTGLGLAISKRVAEAHGGTIRAENRRRGPRFTFRLPLAPVPASR